MQFACSFLTPTFSSNTNALRLNLIILLKEIRVKFLD